jgi:D-alanine-D-alanine ligase
MALETRFRHESSRVRALDALVQRIGSDLALFLVYDRPGRVSERLGLERTYFAERCVSEQQLSETIDAFRSCGAYVELFDGEREFITALSDGRIAGIPRSVKIAYSGIGNSVGIDGFRPGHTSLVPAVCDAYGIQCANSNAYVSGLGWHKFHQLTMLSSLGLPVPDSWHYRLDGSWAADRRPPNGTRVIAKSTYEAWSVGVGAASVFEVDGSLDSRVSMIAEQIGQAVTVQAFVPGREVYVTVFSSPERLVLPPVEAVIARAADDPNAVVTIEDAIRPGAVLHRVLDEVDLESDLVMLARAAFDALELEGFGRVDFRIDDRGRPQIFDLAVGPGIGRGSSAFSAMAALGLTHPQFLRAVIGASLSTWSPELVAP